MTHYQELFIYPDPETSRPILRAQVISSLHIALVDAEKELSGSTEATSIRFGISFPNYHAKLYELDYTIQVFAPNESDLKSLNLEQRLTKIKDILRLSTILPTPETATHATFSRVQQNQSASKLRRFISRNQPTDEQIRAYKAKMHQSGLQEPFVELKSSSTEQLHRIYIRKEMKDSAQAGSFTSYGLSKDGSTVPVF